MTLIVLKYLYSINCIIVVSYFSDVVKRCVPWRSAFRSLGYLDHHGFSFDSARNCCMAQEGL